MTSVNGTDAAAGIAQELQIAQQNKLAAVKTSDTATSGLASSLAKLNSMYNSTGTNNSTGVMGQLAGALGVDPTTLASELQGAKPADVATLISQQMASAAIKSVTGDDSSSDSTDSSSSSLQDLAQNMGTTGTMFDGKL